MVTIDINSEEVAGGSLSPAHQDAALRAINEDGFVVLKDIVDPKHIAVLREKMQEDVAAFLSRKDAPFNWNQGNIQQGAPPFPPYLFRDVLLNDQVISVTKALLGPGVKNHYYSGNTAVKSASRQPVHADTGQLWSGLAVAHPPVQLVINVPVVDMGPENGSTEIWLGTHKDTTIAVHGDIKIPAAVLEARRGVVPPLQPTVSAGSILIRDIRLWHAGMPNHTDQPRPMIAMIHAPSWLAVGRVAFPRGTEAFFEHPHLHTCAEFVDGAIAYIQSPQAYEHTAR